MKLSTEDITPEKSGRELKIYAYSINDDSHQGQLKIGQTTRSVKTRVAEQLRTAGIKYTIELEMSATRDDGSLFRDSDVRNLLKEKGFENTQLEWMRCSTSDVKAAINELRSGKILGTGRSETFAMRGEQLDAVIKTLDYYKSIWSEDSDKTPRFLWNAKMRFGKTFASYQLAKKMKATRVLVLTFKPAVEDSWKSDLESHVDFEGWQFISKASGNDYLDAENNKPIVYFGSFQDLLGKEKHSGNIKVKNKWIHDTHWDLVILDEYHFGAHKERAQELFSGEDPQEMKKELSYEFGDGLEIFDRELGEFSHSEKDFLPILSKAFLYLSGTPFKVLSRGDFIEEQIFNWTYGDEQREKKAFEAEFPQEVNPYKSLPELRLLTYQMPDELIAIAKEGEFNEFDLNTFFKAEGRGKDAHFQFKDDVQKWLNIIRGSHTSTIKDRLISGQSTPFPYSDSQLIPYLQHSLWFLPSVAACQAMANLLTERHNVFWNDYEIVVAAGTGAGIGVAALPPVRKAIGSGFEKKSITLSCGKLTTGVTVPQWSSILMLRNLTSPETYFQAAFRVQSPWSIKNPEGDDPNFEDIVKPVCFIFDFSPMRALRLVADYASGLHPDASNPERAVEELIKYLPVLSYDGFQMTQVNAGNILDISMSGTSATLLARKWESALLVNVDNQTLNKILDDEKAMEAIMKIEGFRSLGSGVFETIINTSENVHKTKKEKGEGLTKKEARELSKEEKEYRSKRKQIQEKLMKFATRIPAFMYLTDFRENTLQDVITKLDAPLFETVTGLTIEDFERLVSINVFNSTHMNNAVFAFRRYEDSSLSYTGIESHPEQKSYGLYDTVISTKDE